MTNNTACNKHASLKILNKNILLEVEQESSKGTKSGGFLHVKKLNAVSLLLRVIQCQRITVGYLQKLT